MSIQLEKYQGQKTRFECPKCGKKRSFTRYINTETGEYIDKRVGICNHQVSCAYHLSPKMFFEMNPEKRKDLSFGDMNYANRTKEIKPIRTMDRRIILKTVFRESNLIVFLKSKFSEQEVRSMMINYFLGATRDKRVIFWQIDSLGRVRAGKMMQYDPLTGKRLRVESFSYRDRNSKLIFSPPVDWVHRHLIKDGLLPKDWEMTQCLFGEHLVRKYPKKVIALVESEKTAIIMSAYYPEYNWMATGGLKSLNAQKIYPIKSFEIMAFPDFGCGEEWTEKADKINKEIGSKIFVSKSFEEIAKKMNLDKGLDIADMFLNLDSDEFAKQFNKATNESP